MERKPRLQEILAKWHRGLLLAYFRFAIAVNQRATLGMLAFLSTQKSRTVAGAGLRIAINRMCVRLNSHITFEKEVASVHDDVDASLVCVYHHWITKPLSLQTFWEAHGGIAPQVLDAHAINTLMSATRSLTPHSDLLVAVCSASNLGSAMFVWAKELATIGDSSGMCKDKMCNLKGRIVQTAVNS